MDLTIQTSMDTLWSEDQVVQNQAFIHILKVTDQHVDSAYEVWDRLLAGLTHKDNHVRAISAQVLANLAKSDPEGRMLRDFQTLLAVTKDERFVTARHCLQSLWKVGAAGKKQQRLLEHGLEGRFKECSTEKNNTLIRYDIIQVLRNLYDAIPQDDGIKDEALALIETETDLKYRKKYASLWKAR
jgi:hypothetical protein